MTIPQNNIGRRAISPGGLLHLFSIGAGKAHIPEKEKPGRKALHINELRVLTGKIREKIFVGFHIIFISNFIVIILRTRKKAPKMHGSVISLFRL